MEGKKLIKSFDNFEAKIENEKRNSNFFRFRLKDIPERLHGEIEHNWKQKKILWGRRELENKKRLLERQSTEQEREKRQQQNEDILPNDPTWLKYCPPSYKEKARERISERILEEQRKQLFNSYSKPKLSGGGINKRVKNLIHDQPGTLTSEVRRLVAKRFQNTQEWIKERNEKEEVEQKEVQKLISDVWNKENYERRI